MNQTILVQPKSIETILSGLKSLELEVKAIKERLEILPLVGLDIWWEWAIKKGEEAIEKGEYVSVKSGQELDQLFASL